MSLIAAVIALGIAGASGAQEPGQSPQYPLPQTPPGQTTVPSNPAALAQQELPGPPVHSLPNGVGRLAVEQYGGTEALLRTPESNVFPGGIPIRPPIQNPVGNDPAAPERGMRYFIAFNCVGCHAANGGGGMGPALSDRMFKFGREPAQIFLTIAQGRPLGMPAWGGILPDAVIWDLVAYVRQISLAPVTEWGHTISLPAMTTEQVPAEFENSADPWRHVEPFSYGQKPNASVKQAK